MLTIAPVASGGSDYYLAEDNYYFLGEKASCWMGTLAPAMGLEGGVQPHDFDRARGLFPGRDQSGKNVWRKKYPSARLRSDAVCTQKCLRARAGHGGSALSGGAPAGSQRSDEGN